VERKIFLFAPHALPNYIIEEATMINISVNCLFFPWGFKPQAFCWSNSGHRKPASNEAAGNMSSAVEMATAAWQRGVTLIEGLPADQAALIWREIKAKTTAFAD